MNLLTDPVFRTQTPDGLDALSLPRLLEALGRDRVDSLLGLQRHQEDAFHIFLCYLAGAVLAREGQTDPRQSADFWLAGIRRLTGRDDDCAWTLVVEDVTQPAFMQAPVSKKDEYSAFNAKTPKAMTPDQLDLLVTARNHDNKLSRIKPSNMEAWIYSIISLQSMTCYLGSGQYGIARSSGGTGCRPRVGLEVSLKNGTQWVSDVLKLMEYRPLLLAGPWHYSNQGTVFTWIPSWNLSSSLAIESLDPFFIEISRAIRLAKWGQYIAAFSASSGPRVLSKSVRDEINGKLGDPWTPIDLAKEAALNIQGDGFTPKKLRELIFLRRDEQKVYEPAFMQEPHTDFSGSCHFYASALARRGKNSNTEGLHTSRIYIPAKAGLKLFGRGQQRDHLATLSETGLNDANQMQNRVLKTALFSLLEGGRNLDKIDWKKREVEAWWNTSAKQFSETWAADFFPWLWRQAEQEDKDAARLEWLQALRDKARAVLDDAIARYPARVGRRYRSRVKAEGLFYGMLFKTFEQLKETHHDAKHSA